MTSGGQVGCCFRAHLQGSCDDRSVGWVLPAHLPKPPATQSFRPQAGRILSPFPLLGQQASTCGG